METRLKNNSIKHSIDKTSETPLCRLCGEFRQRGKNPARGPYRKKLDRSRVYD